MKVNSRFTFDKIRHDRDNDIHLVLDLIAPQSEWQAKRQPLCIIPVVDLSGSMAGEKLHYAKQSLLKLVEHLSSEDYFGLVSFESRVHVDAQPEKMTAERKEQMKAIIGRYQARGSTGLSAGLLEGLKMANSLDLHESTLARVILFTDGEPTHGVTSSEGLQELVVKQMGRASVSTFGYGLGAKQELLQAMAASGHGNFAFVRDPDSALGAFGKELGGLLSTYAQNVVVTIKPRNGHLISEVITDADVEEENDGEVTIKIPHLLSEETFNLVFAAKMAKQKSAGPRQVNAFDVQVSYQILDADGNMVSKTEELKPKIQFVKDGEEQSRPTREVDEIVARAQLVKTQIAAEEAAKKGNFVAANSLMANFQDSVLERGHAGIGNVTKHLGSMYGSAGVYGASAGSRSSLRHAFTRSVSSSGMSAEDQGVLANAGYALSTSTQAKFEEAFYEPSQTPVPAPEAPVTPPVTVGIATSGLGGVNLLGVESLQPLVQQGDLGVSRGVSNNGLPILIGTPSTFTQGGPAPVEAQKQAGKTSKKKPSSSTASGVKKSRSQRW